MFLDSDDYRDFLFVLFEFCEIKSGNSRFICGLVSGRGDFFFFLNYFIFFFFYKIWMVGLFIVWNMMVGDFWYNLICYSFVCWRVNIGWRGYGNNVVVMLIVWSILIKLIKWILFNMGDNINGFVGCYWVESIVFIWR